MATFRLLPYRIGKWRMFRRAARVALLFIVASALVSTAATPASAGLVPCGLNEDDPTTPNRDETVPCSFPCVFVLIHRVFNLVTMRLVPFVSVTMFIVGGAMLMFSGANESWRVRGKQVVYGTAIGVAIALLSWVIVNTTINILAANMAGPRQPQGFPWPWDEPGGICFVTT